MNSTYTKSKKFLAFVFGVAVWWASIIFSKTGFEFSTVQGFAYVGWVLALAASCSEFMLNSEFKKINWTIVLLGLMGYAYSIWTNILGFHSLRPGKDLWDLVNILGGIFMDVFPEVAIAWSLNESKLGDIIGNVVKTVQSPQQVTSQSTNIQTPYKKSTYKAKHRPVYTPPPMEEEDDDLFPDYIDEA